MKGFFSLFPFSFSLYLFYAKMGGMNIINIYDNYNSYFNADLKALFGMFSKIASKSGHKLYLIGGIVRDMLLGRENLDIDITVEGDAIAFADILAREAGAKILSTHESFGTIKVEINSIKLDFASTRSETYPKKGHLPHVREIGCELEKDVIRRDFTINSLAMSLNEADFAHLIDYVGGYDDLKSKKIRILHDLSFVDDPTRIIRALKFSVRLGFEIEENTLKLQREYFENINYDMGYKRVKSELKQTFELNSQLAFDKFIEEKIYKLVTPKEFDLMAVRNAHPTLLINKYSPKHPWLVYLGAICVQENNDFCDKLELTKAEKNIILGAKSLLAEDLSDDYKIHKAFGAQKPESLLIYAIFKGKEGEEKVSHYLNNLKKIKLSISGKDLVQLGFEPSKQFGKILDSILREKIKNPALKKADEIRLAQGKK